MVLSRHDPEGASHEFVIRPNCSLSWQETKVFFIAACTVSLGISAMFIVLGAWPIFPFAGLEMLSLGAALYWCGARARRSEVVTIRGDDVVVAKGRGVRQQRWMFQRHWAQVRLEPPAHDWYASRLRIISHGRGVEVGGCLNEDERKELASDLTRALRGPMDVRADIRPA
jgi:uncharacterized membrane protein